MNNSTQIKQKHIGSQIVGTENPAAAFDWYAILTNTYSLLHGVSWNVNSLNFTFKAGQRIKEFRLGGVIKVLFQPTDGNSSLTAPFERFGCS